MKKSLKGSPAPKAEKIVPKSAEIQRLENVFQLMGAYGVGEVELEDKHGRVHVRMAGQGSSAPTMSYAPAPVHAPAPGPGPSLTAAGPAVSAKEAAKSALAPNQKQIPSPFGGTCYRSSSPSSEPYAKEGQRVKKGQTLCIVEAMKLMNEIECEFDGKIVSVLVENGQPVEFGEPLFIIET